ncbi:hypothetical protein JOC54_004006 [Alkalihalobacillus xiaoxiensis]|uniref:Uncharacterized protein n=1 Tax=Shouchella xiaoxiensis TaxID=766895 RepID=A0ABS2SYV5_9BACI|nr:hypothetical protein [Shouchella xiaoxiensis]MBM7840713.1 hypothetical protein [Shouchella xiaoxiensis]
MKLISDQNEYGVGACIVDYLILVVMSLVTLKRFKYVEKRKESLRAKIKDEVYKV